MAYSQLLTIVYPTHYNFRRIRCTLIQGEHYQEVYDLLGGDYFIDDANKTQTSLIKTVGDKISYNYDGLVKWYGGLDN